MECGGNAKLKEFWKEQKFPLDTLSNKERLDNEAMDKYRENLLKMAKGEETTHIQYIGYKKRMNLRRYDTNSITGFGSNQVSQEQALRREAERKPLVDCLGACVVL